jgi:hypothetical protein
MHGTLCHACFQPTGIFALENNVSRLSDDHTNAQALAKGLSDIPGTTMMMLMMVVMMMRVMMMVVVVMMVVMMVRMLMPLLLLLLLLMMMMTMAGITCDPSLYRTNIVYFDVQGVPASWLQDELRAHYGVFVGSKRPHGWVQWLRKHGFQTDGCPCIIPNRRRVDSPSDARVDSCSSFHP